jgi:hypothetical protein
MTFYSRPIHVQLPKRLLMFTDNFMTGCMKNETKQPKKEQEEASTISSI